MKKRKQKNTKMKRIECTDAKIQYNVTINRGLVDELIITGSYTYIYICICIYTHTHTHTHIHAYIHIIHMYVLLM
jgi:hypothetical protein